MSESNHDLPDESPGLPRLRTWRSVYAFTLGCFVLYVLLLALFTQYYA